ncbi:hypothetical protein H9654_00700 [Stenotrophomonas sp. Sa5BUN4]|uniref:Uncharacterized protein n=1 Tax=Stenotrophomonas lacuserhaii TaxID=2760084 RepID=A0A8X8FPX0_9GAMM|nr:hypothetical protein [Stenotrophomonas pennii]MBD7952710.1 hypothetical protein [Stenotrophomonas pennii]
MKITNNHRGPLGLPDGTVLAPGVEETVANWEQLKKNTVVQGWIRAKILTLGGDASASAPQAPSLLGSNVLPVRIDLVDDVSVSLGDVVRCAHTASGLSIEGWNELDDTLREAKLADAIEQLRSEALASAEVEARTRADAALAAAGAASTGGAIGPDGGAAPDPVTDKAVLVARAKELGVAGVGSHWGIGKLQEAIAEAQKKSEG